jgi:hypothetical protein
MVLTGTPMSDKIIAFFSGENGTIEDTITNETKEVVELQ